MFGWERGELVLDSPVVFVIETGPFAPGTNCEKVEAIYHSGR